MSVKNYLDENKEKVAEKNTKVGKLKLNKKIMTGIAAVLITTTIAIGISGCGNKEKNNPDPTPSGIVQPGEDKQNQSPTPYYDSLYDNSLYFKENQGENVVGKFSDWAAKSYGFELTEEGKNILREQLAKYLYTETTLRKAKAEVIGVLKNHTVAENAFNEVDYEFLTQYVDLLKKNNENVENYSIDEKKLESVLAKFISGEYTEEKDLEKLKEVVGANVLLSELKNNKFGYNEKYAKMDLYANEIMREITSPYYKTVYYGIEDGQTVLKTDADGYIENKYGTKELTLEQMNIDLKNLATEEELNVIFNFEKNSLSYEKVLNDVFLFNVQKLYTFGNNYGSHGSNFFVAFKEVDDYQIYKNNSNVKIKKTDFDALAEEWILRIDEEIIKSKLKYGEYTVEGLKKIESPKILQR
ncbi:MAG: hypothetical protein PHU94_00130 [Bacilli bacterium]|nr:hypothetical protein [Bacilli bacterium]MDD4733889.1 hypothetical protein [Bacilli bacterium]